MGEKNNCAKTDDTNYLDSLRKLSLILSGEELPSTCELESYTMQDYWNLIDKWLKLTDNRCHLATTEDIINIYTDLLEREPTNEEIGYYLNKNSIDFLLCKTYFSDEYIRKCKNKVSYEDMESILLSLCGKMDNRLQNQILSRKITPDILIDDLLQYPDFACIIRTATVASKEDIVNAYSDILGRAPTQDEIDYYLIESINRRHFLEKIFDSEEATSHRIAQKEEYQILFGISQYNIWGKTIDFVFNNQMKDVITTAVKHQKFLWDEEKSYIELLPDNGVFFDIGANIGAIALILGAKGWKGVCFEASPQNVKCLQKSINLNKFDISVQNYAIGDSNEKILFIENGPWGSIKNNLVEADMKYNLHTFHDSCPEIIVQKITLDSWLQMNAHKPQHIDFIKMDIEGSEFAALKGMGKLLAFYEYPAIYSEINGYNLFTYGIRPCQLFELFRSFGYYPYKLQSKGLVMYDAQNFQLPIYDNYLFLHDKSNLLDSHKANGLIRIDNSSLIIQIINGIKNGWSQQKKHLLYTLQDYPEIYKLEQLRVLLNECLTDTDEVTQKAIEWYKEIE